MVSTIQTFTGRDRLRDTWQAVVRSPSAAHGPRVLRGLVRGTAAEGLRPAPEANTETR